MPGQIWELSQRASDFCHQIAPSLRTFSSLLPYTLGWPPPMQQWLALGPAGLKTELTHLLIVSDLIVQDDAIGLLRLWP